MLRYLLHKIFFKKREGKDRFQWKMRENKVELLNRSIFPTVKDRLIVIKIPVLDIPWHF